MKELIGKDEIGMFVDNHDVALVDSRYVARYFEKRHDHVIRDIRELDCSEEFRLSNFGESSYKNDQGKKQPCYYMTRDGFVFLAMGKQTVYINLYKQYLQIDYTVNVQRK
jgi:Rha family phage regulatory protein